MHKDKFKGVVSFEDDLHTGILKDSSKFLTEARNIGNRHKDIPLDLWPVSGFMMRVGGYFPVSFIIKSW